MTTEARARAALPLAAGVMLAVFLAATTANGSAPTAAPVPLAAPDPALAWATRWCDVLALAASVAATGWLLAALAAEASRLRLLRAARTVVLVWAASVSAAAVLRAAETSTAYLTDLRTDLALVGMLLLAATLPGRAGPRTALAALAVVLGLAVALALDGHAAVGDEVLTGALVVHVAAALVWTGGLLGLLLLSVQEPRALRRAAPRFSTVALGCYLALAGSGVLALLTTVPLTALTRVDGYVGVVIAKTVVLVGLGAMGQQHRRRTLPQLAAGRPRAFTSLAAGEVVAMGLGLGLAATLGGTPPPVGDAGASSTGTHPHTEPLVDLTWAGVLTQSRPNAVVLVTLAVLLCGYLSRVRARTRDGASWPVGRTVSCVVATVMVALMTCSGLAVAAHGGPGALVAQLLTMILLVPALLLAARPLQLLDPLVRGRAPGWLERPATGAVAVCGLLVTLQYTPVVSWVLASPWWHLALLLLATGCGLTMWWPTLAAPPGPTSAAALERAGWLLTVAVALGILALRLHRGGDLVSADWFLELRLVGADPAGDRASAASYAGAAAVALLVAAALIGFPQGARESTTPRRSSLPIDP